MAKNLLCFLGFYKWEFSMEFLPGIEAEIVTDVVTHIECEHCSKVKLHSHLVWDGENCVEKTDGGG